MSSKHHERQGGPDERHKQEESRAASQPTPEGDAAAKSVAGQDAIGTAGASVAAEGAPANAELAALLDRVTKAETRVAVLESENADLKDQYLRKLADYENFRKRMFREKEEAQKYGIAGLLGDLVPVLDDFDRAIASAEHARDYQVLHDGIAIIRRQVGSLLETKYGLARFASLNQPFDPNLHEAVASEPGQVEEPTVSEEYLPGYKLHDRLVRSAKVRVRMPAGPAEQSSGDTTPAAGAVSDDTRA